MKISIAQFRPETLNIKSGIEKMIHILEKATKDGSDVVAFGETWLGGYPVWLDHCPGIAQWDNPIAKDVFTSFQQNALILDSNNFKTIARACKKLGTPVLFGCNERSKSGKGSVFNSLFLIDANGETQIHHRKLMPTYTEKLYYALGDGAGLRAWEHKKGKVGGLICWEHWMPHSRMAMHLQGEDIHFALWPMVHEKHRMASQHYAFEGRCFVAACGQLMDEKDIPKSLNLKHKGWLLQGGSCVIDPAGDLITEPLLEKEGLITVDLDISRCVRERMTLDVTGHYNRTDVFSFEVNKNRNVE